MKLTYPEYVHQAYEVSEDGIIELTCANCDENIWTDGELVTPCHPIDAIAEGSGHGGYNGMSIYCALDNPKTDKDGNLNAYCGWGGALAEYEPLLVCSRCLGHPWVRES